MSAADVRIVLRRESSRLMVGEATRDFVLTGVEVTDLSDEYPVESIRVGDHCCWRGRLPSPGDAGLRLRCAVRAGQAIAVGFAVAPKAAAALGEAEPAQIDVRFGPIGHARKITSLGLGLWHMAAVDEDGLVWVRDERGESWVCLEPLPARPEGRGIFNEGLLGVRRAAQVACMSQDGLVWRVVVVDDEGVPWEWMRGPSRGWHMLSPLPSREAAP